MTKTKDFYKEMRLAMPMFKELRRLQKEYLQESKKYIIEQINGWDYFLTSDTKVTDVINIARLMVYDGYDPNNIPIHQCYDGLNSNIKK